MGIGRNIAKYRKIKNWTQLDLAKAANLSRSYISQIENERNPRLKTLAIIAEKLGVSVDELKKISEYNEIS